MLNDKIILVTGGTGSLGKAMVRRICKDYRPKKVIVFSRDEFKQSQMQKEFTDDCLRFFIGDVRDMRRLRMAFRHVDYVIHAAALKQIPTIEYNPIEAVRTNIDGTVNVIEACIYEKVKKAVLISTDKAVNPVNFYGSTKLCAEKLFLAANAYANTEFSVVRYGNVLNSRGSVIEMFLNLKEKGIKKFPITDPEMTRFWITLDEAVDIVMKALHIEKGLIITRDMPSMKIIDVARAIDPNCICKTIGIRPGEKMHETLVSSDDSQYVRRYSMDFMRWMPDVLSPYSSDTNHLWLSTDELRRKIGL